MKVDFQGNVSPLSDNADQFQLCWKLQRWAYEGFGVRHSSSLNTYIENLSIFSWKKVELKEKSARFLACKSQLKIRTASVSQVCLLCTAHITGVKVTCIHFSWSSRQCRAVAVPSLFYLWEKWRPQGCWVAKAEARGRPGSNWPQNPCFHSLPTFH